MNQQQLITFYTAGHIGFYDFFFRAHFESKLEALCSTKKIKAYTQNTHTHIIYIHLT